MVVVPAPPTNVAPALLLPDGAVNVTVMPLIGSPLASFTSATRGEENPVPSRVLCSEPLRTLTLAGALRVLVSEKLAAPSISGAVAVTV